MVCIERKTKICCGQQEVLAKHEARGHLVSDQTLVIYSIVFLKSMVVVM